MGMIEKYDVAVKDKIEKWVGKPVRIVQDVKALYTTIADTGESGGKDEIKFPLYCIKRGVPLTFPRTANTWMSVQGYATHADDGKIGALRAIPVMLKYTIGLFDTTMEGILQQIEEINFLLINNPQIIVDIPFASMPDDMSKEEKEKHRSHTANIFVDKDTQDNSEINNHLMEGRIFAYEIYCNIPDAYLFDVREREKVTLESIDAELKDITVDRNDKESVIKVTKKEIKEDDKG